MKIPLSHVCSVIKDFLLAAQKTAAIHATCAMNLSVIEQRRLWMVSEQESLEAVKAAGVQVNYPDKSLFVNKSKSVEDKYGQDPMIKSFIEKIKNTK